MFGVKSVLWLGKPGTEASPGKMFRIYKDYQIVEGGVVSAEHRLFILLSALNFNCYLEGSVS